MRSIIIRIISFFTKYYLKISVPKDSVFSGLFYRVSLKIEKRNIINIQNSDIYRTIAHITGEGNSIFAKDVFIEDSSITIHGNNNTILIGSKVKLRQANIIIRGNGCTITIGDRTTFGGIRIINAGDRNNISIGTDCLFSDYIELWGSDTHPIYNEDGLHINPEKPVSIGNKVWVGSKVIILKGVTIGDGSVVGMGSIVTKDIPPAVISAGSPNQTIKEKIKWNQ